MASVCQGQGKESFCFKTVHKLELKVRDTYFYFGSSLAATAGTAAAIYRSPVAMNLVPSLTSSQLFEHNGFPG